MLDSFYRMTPRELEVRYLYHIYSLKTKNSQCHYVVTSETSLTFFVEYIMEISHLTRS